MPTGKRAGAPGCACKIRIFPQPRQTFFHPRQSAGISYPAALKMIHSGFRLCFPEPPAILQAQRPPENQWQNDAINFPAERYRSPTPKEMLPRDHGRVPHSMVYFAVRTQHRQDSLKPGSHTLVGQSVATLRTAAGKYLAAVAGRHSFTEAVLLRALTLLRLIRSKHSYAPPSVCLSGWAPAYVPAFFTGICRCQSVFLP